LPSFIPGSGGHRNVFRMASLIEGDEFHSQIFFHEEVHNSQSISQWLKQHYGDFNFEVTSDPESPLNADFVVGVHNSSIPFAKFKSGKKARLVYLVQDFEPWFTPMGVHSLDALSTYFDQELEIITSGDWMARKIHEIRGFTPPYFNFPVDRKIYHKPKESNREGVLFFAKRDTPRRLFELGVEILRELRRQDPNIKITTFGSNDHINLDLEIDNLRMVPSLEELSVAYSTHKLGIAFSPTNPSLVPYEMMACGLPVIDVDLPGNPMKKYGENPLLIPEVYGLEALVARAVKLLGDQDHWSRTSNAGLDFIIKMPSPEQASAVVLDFFRNLRDPKL
jgi:glycosyltransferase involved in cell wall biosynthesis